MVNTGAPKRRNSEKKKEKSRFAARCRRSKEAEIFSQLAETLPLPKGVAGQLDKASIMRLVISCMKICRVMESPLSTIVKKEIENNVMLAFDSHLLRALEGFLLVLSCDGDMVYLSENVNRYLGLTQIDLMGHSIFEFSHPCDHDEIKEMLSLKCNKSLAVPSPLNRSFFFRMKCTLTNKGKNVNLKSASYKVIHCIGKIMKHTSFNKAKTDSESLCSDHCLVTIGEPIYHPSNIEVPLGKQTFLTQHDLDMKFTYADDRIFKMLGYQDEDLMNKSVFQFHHLLDSAELAKSYKTLFAVGQCETGRYRFLAKRGGYAWVLTQATLIYVDKTQKPNCVVCINYFLSGIENEHEVISELQLNAELERVAPKAVDDEITRLDCTDFKEQPVSKKPVSCTTSIFMERTPDMNEDSYLNSSGNTNGITVSDEPEDLTHLAPTPGTECVLLEDFNPDFNDDGDDMRLPPDFYLPVTSMDILSSIKEDHVSTEKSLAFTRLENDPFLCHQDRQSLDFSGSSRDRSETSSDLSSLKSTSPELILEDEIGSPSQFPMAQLAQLDLGLTPGSLMSDHSLDTENEEPISLEGIDQLTAIPSTKESVWDDIVKNGEVSLLSSLIQPKETSNLERLLKSEKRDILTDSLLHSRINGKVKLEYPKGMKFQNGDDLKRTSSKLMKVPTCISKDLNKKPESLNSYLQQSSDNHSKRLSSDDLTCTKKARVMNDDVANYVSQNSVLLNLLRSGKDDSHGYSCLNKQQYGKGGEYIYRSPMLCLDKAAVASSSLKSRDNFNTNVKQKNSKITLGLLDGDGPSMDALLSLTQQDMEVNAPIQSSSHLLDGNEIMLALEQSPSGVV